MTGETPGGRWIARNPWPARRLRATALLVLMALVLPPTFQAVFSLVACTLGGLLVGLWTKRCGFSLDTLHQVIGRCRTQGGYRVRDWPRTLVLFLLACAFAKLALTKLCLASGWVGGEFFPLIFCGVSGGYAVAALMGLDPLLPVAVCAGCLVGAHTGKALMATAVLALCFPPASLPVVLAASLLGVALGKVPHSFSR